VTAENNSTQSGSDTKGKCTHACSRRYTSSHLSLSRCDTCDTA